MAQYKKEDIREKIEDAALKVFAKKTYESATISDISKESKVSVGNIYKYYKGKEEIFYSVLPESFAIDLKDLITNKILMLNRNGESIDDYEFMNERLTSLISDNRERIVMLFSSSKNTKYEGFKDEFISLLLNLVIKNYRIKGIKDIDSEELLLRTIFGNLFNMISSVIINIEDTSDVHRLLNSIIKYHVSGITGIINSLN